MQRDLQGDKKSYNTRAHKIGFLTFSFNIKGIFWKLLLHEYKSTIHTMKSMFVSPNLLKLEFFHLVIGFTVLNEWFDYTASYWEYFTHLFMTDKNVFSF